MEQNSDQVPDLNLDISPTIREPRKFNRRVFIKGLTAAALASTIPAQLSEASSGPDLKSNEIPLSNRAQKLSSLLERYRQSPTKENQEVLTAWLKFNAAESYAASQNWKLTERVLHHFMFGNGVPLDISTDLPGTIYRLNKDTTKSLDEVNWQYFQKRLNSPAVSVTTVVQEHNQRDIIHGYSKPDELEIVTSFRSEPSERELHLALGGFGVRIAGKLDGVDKKGAYGIARISNPELTVFDRYDWDGLNGLKAGGDLKTFLDSLIDKMGIKGVVNISSDMFKGLDFLKGVKIELTDKEGALLVEKGVANEFDVKGKFGFTNPFEVPLMVPKLSPFKR